MSEYSEAINELAMALQQPSELLVQWYAKQAPFLWWSALIAVACAAVFYVIGRVLLCRGSESEDNELFLGLGALAWCICGILLIGFFCEIENAIKAAYSPQAYAVHEILKDIRGK